MTAYKKILKREVKWLILLSFLTISSLFFNVFLFIDNKKQTEKYQNFSEDVSKFIEIVELHSIKNKRLIGELVENINKNCDNIKIKQEHL